MKDTQLKKWKLLKSTDVSPSKWFPIESREYELPDGRIVDDFTVTTLADVAMIVPVTKDGKVVLARQYKPGVDELTLEFPAGRIEPSHADMTETAQHELEEEVGIFVERDQLHFLGKINSFPTKASEVISCFIAFDVEFNGTKHFDQNEEIQAELFSFKEFENVIYSEKILMASTVTCWELAKRKFPEIFQNK